MGATRPDPLPHDIAAGRIRTWLRFKVREISVPIITGALEIREEYSLLPERVIEAEVPLGLCSFPLGRQFIALHWWLVNTSAFEDL
jgi:hypothetical protein